MSVYNIVSFAGLFVLMGFAWLCSSDRRSVCWKTVRWGLILQLLFGALVFLLPIGAKMFLVINQLVGHVMSAAGEGAKFCFGALAIPPGQEGSLGFILAFQGLVTIVFFAALMEILYYTGIMPFLIRKFAGLFTKLMRTSGAESLCVASNIFVGIESATAVKPFLGQMTRSELCTVLTAGMATIASTILGLYVFLLRDTFPNIAGHLVSASLLSAPAALLMSKLLVPETGQPETLGQNVHPFVEKRANIIDAVIKGSTDGGKLVMGVIVLLLSAIGLVALINMGLDAVTSLVADQAPWFTLRLEKLLAFVFYPFSLIIGVPPADAFKVAQLLAEKVILTEVPAYQHLAEWKASGAFRHDRSVVLAAYALCGFTHIPSVAIFVGGITALAPGQAAPLSRVALRALLAATLACLMTAAVAGVFYGFGVFSVV